MSSNIASVSDIDGRQFDVIIIGAGINGAAIARDAAMRGLGVLLVEKHDIGSGTTPWSTRLIHGGLRYLEHGELGLVRESLREREILLRIAPHLVQPLPFLLPIYGWQQRGPRTIRAGLTAYDLLTMGSRFPRHQMLSRDAAIAHAPALQTTNLKGAARYYDAQVTFPERLALENVLDAAAHGATVLTYTVSERIIHEDGSVTGLEVRSVNNGHRGCVRSQIVVNATGPWVDDTLAGLTSAPHIGGTQGSHIIVDRVSGAPDAAIYSEAPDDGRPFFIIPWQRWLLIGTTDIPAPGCADDARPSSDEIDYLLRQANAVLASTPLSRDSVHFTYAGIRPLPSASGTKAGSITRRHSIVEHVGVANGLMSVIGGKLTTHRSLAEQVTDRICRRIGHADSCRTAERPLPGYGSTVDTAQQLRAAGVPLAAVTRLAALYGARLHDLSAVALTNPRLTQPIDIDNDAIAAEIVFAFTHERAITTADVLLRRTMLGLRPGLGMDLLEPTLAIAHEHLGWDAGRVDREHHAYQREIERLRMPD